MGKRVKPKHHHVAIKLGTMRRYHMCWKKKKFTEFESEHYAKAYSQRAYKCPVCNFYHLTTNVGERNAENRGSKQGTGDKVV
jgi:hypothetical protein